MNIPDAPCTFHFNSKMSLKKKKEEDLFYFMGTSFTSWQKHHIGFINAVAGMT